MNKCFLYVGTKILGCAHTQLWTDAEAGPLFEARWIDAANVFLSRYMPAANGWNLLMNVADFNTLRDGERTFQMFRHTARRIPQRSPPRAERAQELSRMGLEAVRDWRNPSVLTTSILAHAAPAGRPAEVDLGGDVRTQNYSGRTRVALLDPMVESMRAQMAAPMFSVTDCNTFHTSGYIWGKYALDSAIAAGGDGAVLIVNFDQHRDYDAAAGLVKSDGWGEPLLKNYRGAFLNIGCQGIMNPASLGFVAACKSRGARSPAMVKPISLRPECKITQSDLSGIDVVHDLPSKLPPPRPYAEAVPNLAVLPDKIRALLEHLKTQVGEEFKYLFVTVDRDCMLNNGTQWGNISPPFLEHTRLLSVMRLVIAAALARGPTLVGMDITGLPEHHGDLDPPPTKYTYSIADLPQPPQADAMIAGLKTEIEAYRRLFEENAAGVEPDPRVDEVEEVEEVRVVREVRAEPVVEPVDPELVRRQEQDHLERLTGGPGLKHEPRKKGPFKGKKTLTFSLTGGGRRRY